MKQNMSKTEISKIAQAHKEALEKKDRGKIVEGFTDDCEIEMSGVTLKGKEGVRKWIKWLYCHVDEVKYEEVKTVVDGNTYFQEFTVKGKLHNGIKVQSKQAKGITYEGGKIKKPHMFFDRLDFVESVVSGTGGKSSVCL